MAEMDVYERRALALDQDQLSRMKRFRGSRDEFFNEYEQEIYHMIMQLLRKSKTYKRGQV